MYKYQSKSKHKEDMERYMGSIEGQLDIWKAWKNWWTYERFGRTGGHLADIKGEVDIWNIWKYGLICAPYILTVRHMDNIEGQVNISTK